MANRTTKAGPRRMWSQRLPISTIDRIVRLRDRLQGERGSAVSQAEVVEIAVATIERGLNCPNCGDMPVVRCADCDELLKFDAEHLIRCGSVNGCEG